MKKKVIIAISSVTVAAVLGLGIYQSNAAQAEPKLSKAEIEELVSAQYPGTITEIELEKGFNKVVYEVEVEGNGKAYEIKLDGNTGEILKLEEKEMKVASNQSSEVSIKEKNDDTADAKNQSDDNQNNKVENKDNNESKQIQKEDDSSKQAQRNDNQDDGKQSKSKNESTKQVVIDAEAAKKIALGAFSGTVTELELDEDDGRLIYEIEMESAIGEAELEIDAYTGEIIYISIDSEIGVSNGKSESDDRSVDLEDKEN